MGKTWRLIRFLSIVDITRQIRAIQFILKSIIKNVDRDMIGRTIAGSAVLSRLEFENERALAKSDHFTRLRVIDLLGYIV